MIVVATYDISQDSRRSRVAALLQAHGDRIQKSVYLLDVSHEDLAALTQKASEMMDLDEDSLYVLAQCANCWDNVVLVGQAEPPTRVLHWAVL